MKGPLKWLGSSLLALSVLIGAEAPAKAAKEEVVLATWGGFYADVFQKSMIDDFTKATGIKVRMIPGISSSNYTTMKSQRENPQLDVIMLADERAMTAYMEGLIEPMSEAEVPNLAKILPGATAKTPEGEHIYGAMFGSLYGFAYRTDLVPFEMTKWEDLWDPRLKNKVSVTSPRSMSGFFLLSINKMAGGNEENIEPGLKRLTTLKDNLVAVVDDGPSQVRMLAQGETWVSAMTAGAAFKAAEEGLKIKFVLPEEGSGVLANVVCLVKDGPNQEAAKKFINHVLSAEAIKAASDALGAPPLRTDVEISPESPVYKYREDSERMLHFDTGKIIDNMGEYLASWDREIAPLVAR